jgi:hypothetical protein
MTPNSVDGMIERVARAIAKSQGSNPRWNHEGWLRDARAAIEAMREPTKAMLEVGPPFPYMDEYVWQTMIDEALK